MIIYRMTNPPSDNFGKTGLFSVVHEVPTQTLPDREHALVMHHAVFDTEHLIDVHLRALISTGKTITIIPGKGLWASHAEPSDTFSTYNRAILSFLPVWTQAEIGDICSFNDTPKDGIAIIRRYNPQRNQHRNEAPGSEFREFEEVRFTLDQQEHRLWKRIA